MAVDNQTEPKKLTTEQRIEIHESRKTHVRQPLTGLSSFIKKASANA